MIADTLDAIRVVVNSLSGTRDLALLAALVAPAPFVYYRWDDITKAHDGLKLLLAALVTQYVGEALIPPNPPPPEPEAP